MKEPVIVHKSPATSTKRPVSIKQKPDRKVFRFALKTLGPVHIGCDEVYEPMCFTIDENAGCMTVFDPYDFIADLSDRDRLEFSNICKEGTLASILKIYKFLARRKPYGRKINVCEGFVRHYNQTLNLPVGNTRVLQQELNRFMVGRTSFLPSTDRPYIPGSALKGALRTAYLNHAAKTGSLRETRDARKVETQLLGGGSFNTDPFRMLKVSDFMPVGGIETGIVYAVNEKKKLSQFTARGPYQILEIIPPGAEFHGVISLESPVRNGQVATPLDEETLFESVRSFFSTEKIREDKELRAINIPASPDACAKGNLIRIGRHSGAESLTIEKFRSIKIMKGRNESPRYEKSATTLWLASSNDKGTEKQKLKPFGWAELLELSAEEALRLNASEVAWKNEFEALQKSPVIHLKQQGSSSAHQPLETTPKTPTEDTWIEAALSWDPGRQQLIASLGTKKAYAAGKELVSEKIARNIFVKKKPVKANVVVNSSFKIIRIDPL